MKVSFLGDPISESDLKHLGGKARNLQLLKLAGFTVPDGFILTQEEHDLESCIQRIGGFPVAVRSSCSMEDMANASFAGLYETFLFIQDKAELKRTVKACFESRDSQRVKDYLEQKHLSADTSALKMSVLVQKMIDPDIAGVLFTLNPTNGFEEEFYLEYCQGVGERLVSGHVTPSECTFNIMKKNIVSERINQEGTKISEVNLKQLIQESRRIQAYFGKPQDIEWAIDKSGKLHLLQSRPITTFTFRQDVPELTNADLKDGGISARVCTPLMFSAYRNAMQVSMGDYFRTIRLIKNPDAITWISHYYGRVYWNAGAVKEGLKQLPGFHEADFDRDLGLQKDYGTSGPHKTALSLQSIVTAVPVLMGLYQEFSDCELMVEQFRDQFENRDSELKQNLGRLSALTDDEYKQWFLQVLRFQSQTERNYFRTIYNNSNFQTEFKTQLKKIKTYQAGDEVELMTDLASVSHLDVQSDLARLSSKADFFGFDSATYFRERELFLKTHYHHGPAELDLTVPRWGENKEWVDDLVRSYVPVTKSHETRAQHVIKRLESSLTFLSKKKFKQNLARSRHFLVIREEMRSYSTRAYYLVRLGVLEFSRRFQIPEHLVFMLELNEIEAFLNRPNQELPDLESRYWHYQAYRYFSAPNDFGGEIMQQKKSMDGKLQGIGCSPGVFIGRARIITDIHQTHVLTKEDVLVTFFTDPGWTPVLARVGGVVTEVGGLLSHAAVIGREYGIPAVLNLVQATNLIKEGSLIKVDGKTGVIEVLEERP